MLDQNHFAEPNQHLLTFLHPIWICTVTQTIGVSPCISLNVNSGHSQIQDASEWPQNFPSKRSHCNSLLVYGHVFNQPGRI
jgi:hypothetical protein